MADTQGQAIPGARIGDKKNQVLPGLTSIRKKKAGDKVEATTSSSGCSIKTNKRLL